LALKKPSVFHKIIKGACILFNVGFIVWLLLCKWVGFHNPADKPTILSLLSFSALFAVLGNVLFIFLWLFSSKKWRGIFSLITLLICWNVARPLIGLNYLGKNDIAASNALGLKVMTWNVHMFDLGEWTQDKASKAKIIKLIEDENPDILCLEEFYWDANDPSQPYTDILQKLGYPYFESTEEYHYKTNFITSKASKNDKINIGHAVFSKFPLRNAQEYNISDTKKMLSVEVFIDSSNIFCLNVIHLTSVGFGSKEMEYISEVKEKGVDAQDESQSKSLLRKLMIASANRADLANKIDSFKKMMDYPVIICGDFNDVPGSYVYNKVKGDLADAFVKKGAGMGRTYRNISPTLRIDYILYDENALKIKGYDRPYVSLSDHFPVIANFTLNNTKGK
jgi:endonuclease/exonuclease/phosphatase family metal-dependent hydrolase